MRLIVLGLNGLAAAGCSRGHDAGSSSEAEAPVLSAGGGFACLQRGLSFDCRLLDYYIANHGQAGIPNGALRSVSFNMYDTCVVKEDSTGACCGDNTNHSDDVPEGTWQTINQGSGQSCGLHLDGSVECWGNGSEDYTPPTGSFVDVRAIEGAACAMDESGVITCWGHDYQGNVVSPSGTWESFILPNSYLCMLGEGGSISCAGYGEVANGDVPTGTGYHSLTGGLASACVLNAENRAVCWGKDGDGLLDAPDDEFEQIAAGSYFTCGLKANGDVKCWGCREETADSPERYCDWDNPAPWWVP